MAAGRAVVLLPERVPDLAKRWSVEDFRGILPEAFLADLSGALGCRAAECGGDSVAVPGADSVGEVCVVYGNAIEVLSVLDS